MAVSQSTHRIPAPAAVLIGTRGLCSIGATLVTFGLNVWVFRQTGSYDAFALLTVLGTLPALFFAPLTGMITDRFDKKRLLIAADLLSSMAVALAMGLYITGDLSMASIAAVTVMLGLASQLRWLSMGALISHIVPKEVLGRANGIQQTFYGVNVMLGPVMGAVGLDLLGLSALFFANLVTYLLSLCSWQLIRVDTRPAAAVPRTDASGFFKELAFGFRWVWHRPGLRRLLTFFMIVNIGVSIFTAAFTPYLLSFSSNQTLAISLGVLGAGALVAGIYLGRRGTSGSQAEASILSGTLFFGLGMFFWGIWRQPALLVPIAFFIGALQTVIMASSQTAWQVHVPREIQGKVFSVRIVTAYGLTPLAILLSVPLADGVFLPLLEQSGTVAASIWGTSPTGPLGMMVSVLGLGVAGCAAVLQMQGGLRLSPAVTTQKGQ